MKALFCEKIEFFIRFNKYVRIIFLKKILFMVYLNHKLKKDVKNGKNKEKFKTC